MSSNLEQEIRVLEEDLFLELPHDVDLSVCDIKKKKIKLIYLKSNI